MVHKIKCQGGIVISGILAGLGLFFDIFSRIIKTNINIPLWVLIVIIPILIYAVIMVVIEWIDVFRKPLYLRFTSMEYEQWLLKWNYKPTKYYEYYNIVNIRPVCRKCGCELDKYYADASVIGLYCPVCDQGVKHPDITP
jgi:hypothetical protein